MCATVLLPAASARADTVTDWNAIATTAIVTTAGQSPHAATPSLAMVQGAVYDAVNAIDGSHRPYLGAPPADPSDSKQAAAATAAFRVLGGLCPGQLPPCSRSMTHGSRSFTAVPGGLPRR